VVGVICDWICENQPNRLYKKEEVLLISACAVTLELKIACRFKKLGDVLASYSR